MNKRIRNKKTKENYLIYKGQSIVVNSPYSYKGNNVVLFYCPVEGCEIYFKSVGKAKRYLDSIDRITIPENSNNIPF